MGIVAGFKITGDDALRAALASAAGRLDQTMVELGRTAAEIVKREADSIVPVMSGTLQGSIRVGGGKKAIVRAGKKSIPYAGVIHFGWPGHNIEPQPFLYEAADQRAEDVIKSYQEAMDRLTEQVGAQTP